MTSVTGGGLGVCAAGGTEQVGLFIRRTGRLSPLGGGWNILKEDTRKVWELLHLCTIIISCNKCHRYGNTGNVENQNTCKFASIQICIFLFFFFPLYLLTFMRTGLGLGGGSGDSMISWISWRLTL